MKCKLSEIKYYFQLESNKKEVLKYKICNYFIAIKGECNSTMNVYRLNVWLDSNRVELITDEGSIFVKDWNEEIEIIELRICGE